MKLRSYQEDQVKKVLREFKAVRATILQSPVATGKTRMGLEVVERLGRRTLWLAHTKELVSQAKDAADALGLTNIDFVTIQSEYYRAVKGHQYSLIVVDECHRTVAGEEDGMYRTVLVRYPKAKVLGLTATPLRLDGVSLYAAQGGVYDSVTLGETIGWHYDNGTVLKPRHYTSPQPIDLKGMKKAGEDYSMEAAARRLNTQFLCGNVVNHYMRLASPRQALVFACNVAHARALAARFNKALGAGAADYIDGVRTAHRDDTITKFKRGELRILVNVFICTEGWDYPELGCVILARPTKSRTAFVQMVGRVMRMHAGKKPILLDHGGVFHNHGQVGDPFDWMTGKAVSPRYTTCPDCGEVYGFPLPDACDTCGHKFEMEVMAGPARVRKSTYEESAEALVRAEKVKPKYVTSRQLEADWTPYKSVLHKLTSEEQYVLARAVWRYKEKAHVGGFTGFMLTTALKAGISIKVLDRIVYPSSRPVAYVDRAANGTYRGIAPAEYRRAYAVRRKAAKQTHPKST